MRCAICDAKVARQPAFNIMTYVLFVEMLYVKLFVYDLEEDDNIQCLQDLSENY